MAVPRGIGVEKSSIVLDAQQEALRFKWIESEKAGRDLGDAAVRRWVQNHWWGYLRARWLEHLQGKRYWVELDPGDFGLLLHHFHENTLLLDRILDRLKAGQEPLDIIVWALDWGINMTLPEGGTNAPSPPPPADPIELPRGPAEEPSNAPASSWVFLRGMGSVLELFPSLPTFPGGVGEAEALRRDWEVVGADLWAATRETVRQAEAPHGESSESAPVR
jgi:hypothetical protein